MVHDHDGSTWAQRLDVSRKTGRVKEEFTMMGWYGGGMGPLGWLAMGVFRVFLLGLIVWLVIRLLPAGSDGPTRATGESTLDILDRRLASGEIDLETWQAQRAALLAAQRDGK
jgi:putative membrane protein